MKDVRTWVEIDASALRRNAEQFLRILGPEMRLMAVIKSNAYGHGLSLVAKNISRDIPDLVSRETKSGIWFGVDSIVEGLRLRRDDIRSPILALGYTMPVRMRKAAEKNIALTVSNFESLRAVAALKKRPAIHLKIDTGLHRQGFFPSDVPEVIRLLQFFKMRPEGIYTHFASAKDPANPRYTEKQLSVFKSVVSEMERAGFTGMIRHAAASSGTLLFPESHLDMARVGMGLYGYWPSPEAKIKDKRQKIKIDLRPVLAWKTIVSEVKTIPKGSRVGYDCTERVRRLTKIAVLPVGYWHGYGRGLSKIGEALVRGKRAKTLGRISMDMTVIDVTDIPKVRVGDEVVLIGKQGEASIFADEIAAKINTSAYELLTRINPLIKRIVK